MSTFGLPPILRRLVTVSPLALPLCLVALLLSLWFGPRSSRFLVLAAVLGVLASSLLLLYWYFRREDVGAIFFGLLAGGSISIGYIAVFRLAFGYEYDPNNLWLAVQYNAMVLIIVLTTLQLASRRLERMVE